MIGRPGSRIGSGGCCVSHASSGAKMRPNWFGFCCWGISVLRCGVIVAAMVGWLLPWLERRTLIRHAGEVGSWSAAGEGGACGPTFTLGASRLDLSRQCGRGVRWFGWGELALSWRVRHLCFDTVPDRLLQVHAVESGDLLEAGRRGHVDLGQPVADHVDADEDHALLTQHRSDRGTDLPIPRAHLGFLRPPADMH